MFAPISTRMMESVLDETVLEERSCITQQLQLDH
jgi:hypothetical protein